MYSARDSFHADQAGGIDDDLGLAPLVKRIIRIDDIDVTACEKHAENALGRY